MNTACKKVCARKGAGGADEVTAEELGYYIGYYIRKNRECIREQIRHREYKLISVKHNACGRIRSHCGDYVAYILFNYLLNVAGMDIYRGLRGFH